MDRKTRIEIGLLILIVLVVFSQKIEGQFLSDDFALLLRARNFVWSLKGLPHIAFFSKWFRPIPVLTWFVLYSLFKLNAIYYHAVILMFHIVNTLLVYWIAKKTIRDGSAFIVAGLFGVFTPHIEAINWLSCLFDIQCSLFFLVSYLTFAYFLDTKRRLFYILSIFSFVLSLLSKETALAFAVVSLGQATFRLWDKEQRMRTVVAAVAVSLPYTAISVGYIFVRERFFRDFGVFTPPLLSFFNTNLMTGYFSLYRDFLVPIYKDAGLWQLSSLAVPFFGALLGFCYYFKPRARKTIALGLLWTFATAFFTVANRGGASFASRWHYLPSIGFCFLLGQLLISIKALRLKAGLMYAVIALFAFNTIYHNQYWIKAWTESERIQRAFQETVVPRLEEGPASAYFFDVPLIQNEIFVFFTGLPQCFSLLSTDPQDRFFIAREVVPPKAYSPEKTVWDNSHRSYYLFEWDTASNSFKLIPPVLHDSTATSPEETLIYSWNFSKSQESSRWEAANDLALVFDKGSHSYLYFTTGPSSFLKSPYIDRRVKYFEVTFRLLKRPKENLSGQLLWVTPNDLSYDGKKSLKFSVSDSQSWQTYLLPVYVSAWSMKEPIFRFGLRLSDRPETLIQIKSIKLYSY